VLVWGAVNRAVLSGRAPDRWAHFRFSMDELHLLVVGIMLFVGFYIGIVVIAILAAVVFGITAFGSGGEPSLGWFFGLFGVVGITLIVALAMAARTSLIAPATIQLKRLALPEGWRLARGQTLRLMGMLALTLLIYTAIYLLTVGLVVAVVVAIVMSAGPWDTSGAQTFGELLPDPAMIWVWVVVAAVPLSFLMGVFMALYVAPAAHAFRQLWERQSPRSLDPLGSSPAESERIA
jgi:MFS family permease